MTTKSERLEKSAIECDEDADLFMSDGLETEKSLLARIQAEIKVVC